MSATDRPLAILNPAAVGGRCGKQAAHALSRLKAGGIEADVTYTSRAGDGTRLARAAWAEGRREIIAIGGDGTSYEVVNGLFPEAKDGPAGDRPTLGFLPLGTGNSFLRDFTDRGAEHSIQAIVEGRSQPCDVIELECREASVFYINILSFGFTAEVGALTNRRFKRLGQAGYNVSTVLKVLGLRSHVFPMSVDGAERDETPCTFVSLNNSRFTGGKMMMAPHADTADGKVAVVVVGEMGRIELLRTFPKIFEGTHVDHPAINATKATEIAFDVPGPIDLMIDGEVICMTPRHLRVLPGALNVRV